MLRERHSVRRVAQEIADAIEGAMEGYRAGRVSQEPQLTDRIIGAVEERFREKRYGGIVWRAKTLRTGRGIAAEEQRHGADLLGVLDIDLSDFHIKKGFLAQAKLAEPKVQFSEREWIRLVQQCKTMLERTSAAFVFAYSRTESVRIIPATAIVGFEGRDLFELYHRAVASFFESFIECFIGDIQLNSPDIATLDNLLHINVKRVFELRAREEHTFG